MLKEQIDCEIDVILSMTNKGVFTGSQDEPNIFIVSVDRFDEYMEWSDKLTNMRGNILLYDNGRENKASYGFVLKNAFLKQIRNKEEKDFDFEKAKENNICHKQFVFQYEWSDIHSADHFQHLLRKDKISKIV